MDNISQFLPITKKQLFLIIVYVVILASIPVGLILVKDSQIFKSAANKEFSLIDNNSLDREVPSSSPLDDLKKQLEGSGSTTTKPTPTPSAGVSFGPTLTFKIAMEGRPITNQAAKVFVGLASGTVTVKPTYILTFSVDMPASGAFSGLSLAGLTAGSTYTAYIKGPSQIDSGVTFTMSPSETLLSNNQAILLTTGDVNEDNTIDNLDYLIVRDLYGTSPTSSIWNPRADFNADGAINNWDLAYINKNTGKTGSSGVWYSKPPIQSSGSAEIAPYSPEGSPSSLPSSFSIPSDGGQWLWIPN